MERFYLIVGDVALLSRLVPLGVRLVQLRIKDQPKTEIRRQITLAREICREYNAQLVVNDYWELAIDLGCDFVHLGQEDMDNADFDALRRANIRFGLSTHDDDERTRALSLEPDYIALGPIYPTLLKQMKWAPQGLEKITRWKHECQDTPLVAIGGLTIERLPGVFGAGADSAAVVTDIQQAPDPQSQTRKWISACKT
ncbi:thiamine phosphate synthase [Loktanella sp. S4079]|uniref:thiamine phosphate synthase n=1 Tax=Loktanella sp. S4079 TaxID=579483 RepID=UPI0005F9F880|nr:thiamine phosphate synthase [Loktanella sp. S4079]KJZ18006.1 thiamine-phosphate pyrophosphorylase [Loktanella sp. S4079]